MCKTRKDLEDLEAEQMQWLTDHVSADITAIREMRSRLAATIEALYILDKQDLNIN